MATPTTRRSSASKSAPGGRPRRPSAVGSTHVDSTHVGSTHVGGNTTHSADTRSRRAVIAVAVGAAVALFELLTGSLGSLWPAIPASALLAVLGSAVMPLLRTGRAEQHAEQQRLADLERAARHQSLTALDAMPGGEFELFIAGLCHRDGFTVRQHSGGSGDLGADVVADAPDGRRIVIQCKRYKPGNAVPGPDLQRFLGTVRAIHNADVPVFVTTAWRFTKQSRELAAGQQVVLIDRDLLSHWNNGISLDKYLPAPLPDPV
jgi:restriction system protein